MPHDDGLFDLLGLVFEHRAFARRERSHALRGARYHYQPFRVVFVHSFIRNAAST